VTFGWRRLEAFYLIPEYFGAVWEVKNAHRSPGTPKGISQGVSPGVSLGVLSDLSDLSDLSEMLMNFLGSRKGTT